MASKKPLHTYLGDWTCKQIPHYMQTKRLYSVHVIPDLNVIPDCTVYNVYYQKNGYPMFYAFGIPERSHSLSEVFTIAWLNIDEYKEDMFDD